MQRAGVVARLIGTGAALALLAGCVKDDESRPRAKPEQLNVAVLQSDAGAPGKQVLTRGRISTKSGDILILEPDG